MRPARKEPLEADQDFVQDAAKPPTAAWVISILTPLVLDSRPTQSEGLSTVSGFVFIRHGEFPDA